MKIVTWNVNGIRAIAKKGFFEFFSKVRPDILCLQETKAHPDQVEPELLNPFHYKSYWSAATRPGYSGVVTYCLTEPKSVQYGIGIRKFDSEGRIVITEFDQFTLYNIYFPNGSSGSDRHEYKQEFLTQIRLHLERLIKNQKKIIVLGDYNIAHQNIDVYDPEALQNVSGFLPQERLWFSQFLQTGFCDAFRKVHGSIEHRYTWWNYIDKSRMGNRGWRLDYICASQNLVTAIKGCDILDDVMGSDHCPVVLDLEVT